MKVEDILKNLTPKLEPRESDGRDLAALPQRLSDAGFDWKSVQALLGTPLVVFAEFPGYLWRCKRSDTPCATLVLLWLLGEKVARDRVEALLGASLFGALVDRGILKVAGDRVSSTVDLYPCEGAWVFTDHSYLLNRERTHVYELGSDSYGLARMTPRRKVDRVLDLCTGSGIHAILASRHSNRATGVDLSERALKFSRINAALNGAAQTRFVQGDLLEAVGGETFDLILANPPWIASPDSTMELYRWGGETGEFLTRRIIEAMPRHLAVGGTLAMFVIYPIIRGQRYLDRFASWLPSTGWGVALAESVETTLENFIRLHLEAREDWGKYMADCARWMDAYDRHGIERMGIGMAYLRRLPESRPGWAATRRMVMPPEPMGDWVAAWLDDLETYHDPAWTPHWTQWRPRRSERVRRAWRNVDDGTGQVEFTSPHWGGPVHLNTDQMKLFERIDGQQTAAQLAKTQGREQTHALLRSLGTLELL